MKECPRREEFEKKAEQCHRKFSQNKAWIKAAQQAKKAEQQLKDKHKVEVTGINDRMASIKQELQSSKEECKALKSSQKELEKQAKKKSQESKQQKSSKSQSASRQKSMTMKQTKSNKKLKAGDNQLEDKTDTL